MLRPGLSPPPLLLGIPNRAVHILKSPGTSHTPETQGLNGRLASVGENAVNAGVPVEASIGPTRRRLVKLQVHPTCSTTMGWIRFTGSMGLTATATIRMASSLAAAQMPTRREPAVLQLSTITMDPVSPVRTNSGAGDGKINGLHGPKHKRGDMDREFNRFVGTRLEDLQDPFGNYLCQKLSKYFTDE
ncbi:RNA-binding protein [Mycena sanguinolenta]|uniref:RNA-binding protein n=1 Tax=Mycena sanguinolenta TaxID=230812 RepID=A0A8H6XP14_9AGAR|nr:RNA-binding protein [Mycena sanguinolenta]